MDRRSRLRHRHGGHEEGVEWSESDSVAEVPDPLQAVAAIKGVTGATRRYEMLRGETRLYEL